MSWPQASHADFLKFVSAFNQRHRRVTRFIYIIIAISMITFGLWDVIELGMNQPRLPEVLWTRFLMTGPILIVAYFASFIKSEDLRLDWHMTAVCMAVGLCVVQIYFLFHELGKQIAIDGLILFSVAVYFIPSMFFYQKLLIGMTLLTGYFIFLYSTGRPGHAFIHATIYLGLLNIAGSIHSVSFDRSIKLNFQNNQALEKLVHTDQLTGVDNRYQFDERFTELLLLAKEENTNVFLAIVDIDHFKQYNDLYGHLEGDDCLVAVSKALRQQTKGEFDHCIRFGGEEFILVKYGLSEDELLNWCDLVLHSISDLRIRHENSETAEYVTVSVGAVVWKPDSPYQRAELMARADEALYKAKSTGRNRVVVS